MDDRRHAPPNDEPPSAESLEPSVGEGAATVVPIGPELDLHTFAPRDIPFVVDDYIAAAHEKGLRDLRLVHGRGKGVQRAIVQKTLEKHPLVEEFWDDARAHLGATCCRLK